MDQEGGMVGTKILLIKKNVLYLKIIVLQAR